MNFQIDALIAEAQAVVRPLTIPPWGSAGTVGAALLTTSGNIYTGICIDLPCSIGFCAEHAAVAEMLKHGEREVVGMVAVGETDILPPCGRCRELVMQLSISNGDCQVILPNRLVLPLKKLLPHHWLENKV